MRSIARLASRSERLGSSSAIAGRWLVAKCVSLFETENVIGLHLPVRTAHVVQVPKSGDAGVNDFIHINGGEMPAVFQVLPNGSISQFHDQGATILEHIDNGECPGANDT